MLTLNLDTAIEAELNALAEQSGQPLERWLKGVILDYLEDIHDAALGDQAMDRLINGETTTITLAEWEHQLNEMAD